MQSTPHERLYQDGMQCIDSILDSELIRGNARAASSLRRLEEHPNMRNIIMGLPENEAEVAVGIPATLAFHCHLQEGQNKIAQEALHQYLDALVYQAATGKRQEVESNSKSRDTNRARKERLARRREALLVLFGDPAVLAYCVKHFPTILSSKLMGDTVFLDAIVGDKSTQVAASMKILFDRMRKIEDYMVSNQGLYTLKSKKKLGQVWFTTDQFAGLSETLVHTIENDWEIFFCATICKRGYLDKQAGIDLSGGSTNASHEGKEKVGVAHYLQAKTGDRTLGGVIDWSMDCLSPDFIKYFWNDALPTLGYMKDPTFARGTRFVRCESPAASHQSPILFQMGTPPSASLFHAVQSSKLGDKILQICNYVEGLRYKFFWEHLAKHYGKAIADIHCPKRKVYDLLFSVISPKSFAFHQDSRHMLFDDTKMGWEEKFMRVITLYFQNLPGDYVGLKLRQVPLHDGCPVKQKQFGIALGKAGMHEQGNYCQVNLQHSADSSQTTPKNFRRCTWTARSTVFLQQSGLNALRMEQQLPPNEYGKHALEYSTPGASLFYPDCVGVAVPTVMGSPLATTFTQPHLQANSPLAATTNKTIQWQLEAPPTLPSKKARKVPTMAECIRFQRRDLPLRYRARQLPRKHIRIPASIPKLLRGLEGLQYLLDRQMLVNLTGEGGFRVPCGPCVDLSSQVTFAQLGASYPTDEVHKHYGVPLSAINRPAWNGTLDHFASLHLSKRYKSSLGSLMEPHSAAADAFRVLKGEHRKGFFVFGSGGNGSTTGSSHATVDAPVPSFAASAGVMFESSRDMALDKSARNKTITEASKQAWVVTVFFSDDNIPQLNRSSNGRPMSIHGGMYSLSHMQMCHGMDPSMIKKEIKDSDMLCETMPDMPKLKKSDIQYLSFRRSTHFKYWLTPVAGPYATSMDGWSKHDVPIKCGFRIYTPVPRSFCANDLTMAAEAKPRVTDMLKSYFQQVNDDMGGEDYGTGSVVVQEPLPRSLSPGDVLDTIRRLLLGYSFRVLHVNVHDNDKAISGLCDIPRTSLASEAKEAHFAAHRYWNEVGNGKLRYCSALGQNVQDTPYPCPFPAGDAKVAYLQQCNLDGHQSYREARESRHGASFLRHNPDYAARLLIQSFVAETTGNVACNAAWWEDFKSRNGLPPLTPPQLPSDTKTCLDYIAFLESYTRPRNGSLHDFLQGHYRLHPKYCHVSSFRGILMRIVESAPEFIETLTNMESNGPNDDTRQQAVEMVAEFLASQSHTPLDLFHASRVVADMEELVAGDPFGQVRTVPLGVGSSLGEKLVDWDAIAKMLPPSLRSRQASHLEMLLALLQYQYDTNTMAGDGDLYGYLFRNGDGSLYQTINGRPLNLVDAEHLLCKLYLFMEHEPGGARAASHAPQPQAPHCFPVKGVSFPVLEGKAREALRLFKVEYYNQGINYFPSNDQYRDMAATISTEMEGVLQCQNRRRGETVYTNSRVVSTPLPKHIYSRVTFVCGETWDARKGAILQSRGVDHEVWKDRILMRVLEDASYGRKEVETRRYSSLKTKDITVHSAREVESLINQSMHPDGDMVDFANTFTLHSQSVENSGAVSAYYYHLDKGFTSGRVFILPIQGISFFLVSAPRYGLKRKDDSRLDFEEWKATLMGEERKKVDGFVKDFEAYAKKEEGHDVYYIYKLSPGTCIAFESTRLVHCSIIPAQDPGKPRKILIFHRLLLYTEC